MYPNSNNIQIEDVSFYDVSNQNNLSKYTANNGTITYDLVQQAYAVTTKGGESKTVLNNISFSNELEITADVMLTTQGNAQIGFIIGNLMCRLVYANYGSIKYVALTNVNDSGNNIVLENVNLNLNEYYSLKLTILNNIAVLELIQNNNVLKTLQSDVSSYISSSNEFKIYSGFNPVTNYIKNIKVKAL